MKKSAQRKVNSSEFMVHGKHQEKNSTNHEPITNNHLVKIGEASQLIGVSIDTLRRWEKKGWLQTVKTPGGTRLYDKEQLIKLNPNLKRGPKSLISPLLTPIAHPPAGGPQIPPTEWQAPLISPITPISLSTDQPILKISNSIKPNQIESDINNSFSDPSASGFSNNLVDGFKKNLQLCIVVLLLALPLILLSQSESMSFLSNYLKGNHYLSNLTESASAKLDNTPAVKIRDLTQKVASIFSPQVSQALFGYPSGDPPGTNLNDRLAQEINPASQRDSAFLNGNAVLSGVEGSVLGLTGEVLQASSPSESFLEINLDTEINGTASISGNLTAPNIVYSITPGTNISVTGDPQRPTISSNITVPTATTTTLGIASFSTDFFTVTAGAVSMADSGITTLQIKDGTVSNSDLGSSSITISPGSGISGGGAVSLGGSVSIANSGVISITGTSNQVIASAATGAVTLSLPQDIATSSTPTFVALKVTGSSSGTLTLDTAATTTSYTLTLPGDDGTNNYVLTTDGDGNTAWEAVAGGACTNCIVTDPATTQTITPTATTATGLSIAQAASGSVDIFNVTNNAGSTKYLKVDSSGNTTIIGSTINTGTLTSSSTLTASNGFTMTTGALNLTATSGSISATGLSAATVSVTSGTLALATATSGNITLTTGAATGLVNVLTGNLKVGDGTPGVTLDGEDAYVEGTLEVDGASQLDGALTTAGTLTSNGTLTANGAVNLGDGGDAITISGTTITLTANTAGNDITLNLVDNNTDALDIQQGTNNYININTTDSSEAIQLGNTTTNPSLTLLGSGVTTLGGDLAVNGSTSADITSTTTTASVFNSTVTTLNIGGAATTLNIGPTGSGASSVLVSGGSADTGCTVNGATGDLTCSGNITGSGSGTAGFWSRSGTTLSTATANDSVTVDGTLTATADTDIGNAATDTLTLTAVVDSNLSFIKEVARTIQITDTTTADTAGALLTLKGAAGNGTGAGGALALTGGAGGATGAGGAMTLTTGAGGSSSGSSGALSLASGTATSGSATGTTTLSTGNATAANSGALTLSTGTTTTSGVTGAISITSGNSAGNSGAVSIDAGTSSSTVGTVSLGNTTATTVSIGTTAATTLNFGAGGALTRAIAIGTGTGADTINIGTGGTTADAITIGNNASSTSLAFTSGTGSQTHTSSVVTGTTTSSAFVFNASALTTGTALYLTSTSTSGKLMDLNATNTSGTIFNLAYGSSTTLAGDTTGLLVDLNSGTVVATNQNLTGVNFKIPTVTNTITTGTKTLTGMLVNFGSGAGINQNGAGGTLEYIAGDFQLPALTQSAGTLNAYGLKVTTPATITTGGTAYGAKIVATGVGAGTLYGVSIDNITGGAGTEYAFNVAGTGWDAVLRVGSTTVINGLGITQVVGGGTGLATVTQNGVLYGNAAATLGVTAEGATGQVLIGNTGGAPSWGTISGSTCTNCLINNPSSDQSISPTGQATTGLQVRQTSTASPTDDIFQVTDSAGSTKYFYVDKDGNVSTGAIANTTLTLTPTSNTTALTLVGTNVTSAKNQYINTKNSSGTIFDLSYGAAQTLAGTIIAHNVDISTNVTATNQSVSGYVMTLPAATNTSGTQNYKGLVVTGGALNSNTGNTALNYYGADITIPAITQTAGTLTAYGIQIDTPSSITTGGTAYGLQINASGVGAGTLIGTDITSITPGAGTETGLQIGSGWDTNLLFNDTTTRVAVADGGTITILDSAGNSLCTITDSGSVGDLSCSGTIGGTGTVGFWSKTGTTLTPSTANDIVSIPTTNTTGADLAVTNTGIYTGTGIFNLTANSATTGTLAAITGNGLTSGKGISVSSSATAFTGNLIDVTLSGSNAANTGSLAMLINSGTASTNTAFYIKHYATGTNNLAMRVDDVSGDTTPFVINGDGNVGIHTTTPAADLTILQTNDIQGTGGLRSYNDDAASSLSLFQGNDDYTHLANMGAGGIRFYVNSFGAQAMVIQTDGVVIIGGTDSLQVSSVGDITFVDADGAASITGPAGGALLVTAPATALNLQSDGAIDVNLAGGSAATGCTVANSTGNLTCTGNITGSSSGTAGFWTRTSTTLSPATANDIVSIANTNTTGADLAVTNTGIYTGTGIFNLTANSATTGDILTLSATALTTGSAMILTGPNGTGVTDDFVKVTADIGSAAALVHLSPDFTGSAVNGYGLRVSATDSTANGNSDYAQHLNLALTGNAAKTGYGLYANVSSTSTTADNVFSVTGISAVSGATSTGTRSIRGIVGQPVSTAASTGGTANIIGGYFVPSSTLSNPGATDTTTNNVYGIYTSTTATLAADCTTNCTTNQYGVFVDNGSSDTDGTSRKYGLYIAAQSGADTNYGAYIASNVGIGADTTPDALLELQTAAGEQMVIDASTTANTTTSGVFDLNVTSSTTNNKAAEISTTFTSTGATTSYGLSNIWASSAVVTGASVSQTGYGIYNTATKTGADDATGTYALVGSYNSASNTGRTAAGTVNTYAGQFYATGDTAGTTTTTGLYVSALGADANFGIDIAAISTAGTTNTGIRIGAVSGATNNYALTTGGGNVGIGLAAPSALLGVNGSISFEIDTSNVTKGLYWKNGSSGAYGQVYRDAATGDMVIDSQTGAGNLILQTLSGGNVGINDTTPDFKLDVVIGTDGVVARFEDTSGTCDINPISTALVCASDVRKKKDISDIGYGLDEVLALRAVDYKWKNQSTNDNRIGFIAQEVEMIIPELVSTDSEGYKSLAYGNFSPVLVKAIQELNYKVENALLTINSDGSASLNLDVEKITVSTDVVVGGLVSASNFALDASLLNQTGALASMPVDSSGKVSVADAINAISYQQSAISNQIMINDERITDAEQLSNQAIEQSLSLDEKVASTSANLASLSNTISELLASLGSEHSENSDNQLVGESDISESQKHWLSESSEFSENDFSGLTPPDLLTASGSAILANLNVTDTLSTLNLSAMDATVSATFKSLGETFLGKTTIAGDLSIDGTMSFTNGNSINAFPILFFQNSPLAQAVDIFNGKVKINKEGLIEAESLALGNQSLGEAIIEAGQTEITINSSLITHNSKIFITPISPVLGNLYVDSLQEGQSFKVKLSQPNLEDVRFNWMIIQSKQQAEN